MQSGPLRAREVAATTKKNRLSMPSTPFPHNRYVDTYVCTRTHTGATSIMNTYVHDKTVTRGGQEGKGMNKEKREKGGKKNWFDRLKVARDFCSFDNDVHNRNFGSIRNYFG